MRILHDDLSIIKVTIEEETNQENLICKVKFDGKEYIVNGIMADDTLNRQPCDKGFYFFITQLEQEYDMPEDDLGTILSSLNYLYSGENLEYFVDWR